MSVSEQITRLQTAKADIASAITSKGVEVPEDATLDEMATYINQIDNSDGSYAPYSHVEDTDNPHSVTIGQIGAAPSNFVSDIIRASTEDELNTSLTALINGMSDGDCKIIRVLGATSAVVKGGNTLCIMHRANASYAHCLITCYGYPNASVWVKNFFNGSWNEIERLIGANCFSYSNGTLTITTT